MSRPRPVSDLRRRLGTARHERRIDRALRRIVTFAELPDDVRDRVLLSRRRVLVGHRFVHRSPLATPGEREFTVGDRYLSVLRDVLVNSHHGFARTTDGWILQDTAIWRPAIEAKIRSGELLAPTSVLTVDRPVINLDSGPKTAGFYHVWFDNLTKLLWLGEPEVTDAGPKLLLHSRPLAGWLEQLVRNALPPDVDLLRVGRDVLVRAPRYLDLPSSGSALRDPTHVITLRRWADAIMPDRPIPSAPRRVFVSRRRARWRRILNEPEVIAVLESRGFTAVVLEDLPMAEQIALFRGADVVVAQHGSGLTHLLHARPGTRVLEIQSAGPDQEQQHYRSLAEPLGLVYANLYCDAEEARYADATVPLDALAEVVDRLLALDRTDGGPPG